MTNGEDGSDLDPVKTAPLKELVKAQSDKRAGSDAVDLLIMQMEFLAESLWRTASQYADERGAKTVQEQDVQEAYDDLLDPHDLLKDAAEEMQLMSRTMNDYAERSPIFIEYESENDDD